MTEKTRLQYEEVTGAILSVAFDISNELGCGFLEKVYENAMATGLRASGLKVTQQVPVRVKYLGQIVGDYIADMIVENSVLVEIKATEQDHPIYIAQTLNYLKATGIDVGLLLNFGKPKLSYKRLLSKTLLVKPDSLATDEHG
jgi:GxxExxY protein